MKHTRFLLFALTFFAFASMASAVPTTITVRAVSRDAKVIGDGVGGARITIRDVATGKVLAEGMQTGGTGDTKKIMSEPRVRGGVVYATENAASFEATLDLDAPTRIEVVAEGPLKYPQAMQRASKTLLVLPGQHIEGEGVLLEIPGFIIDFLAADASKLRVKVVMTCGCPTEPGGMWNADQIAISARITRGGKRVAELPLKFAGETSTYEAAMPQLEAGTYEIEVLAADTIAANFGRAVKTVTIAP